MFETERILALVTDIATGGELFDKIVEKGKEQRCHVQGPHAPLTPVFHARAGHYSEKEASEVTARLLDAIKHLHAVGIVHRDIKPENILLEGADSDVDVKLSDFGLAKVFSGDEMGTTPDNLYGAREPAPFVRAHGPDARGCWAAGRARAFTVCGTDYYVAPEVLQQAGYTSACDLWSIGVVLYILLSGCPPFFEGGEEGISVQRKIIAGNYTFPDKYWADVSAEAKVRVQRRGGCDRPPPVQPTLGDRTW